MSPQKTRLHAIIQGNVQGVSFRYHTKRVADSIGVTGWVRNLPGETVEVLAEGTPDQIRKLVDFLQVGPPAAKVDSINTTYSNATDEFRSFEITYHTCY